MENCLGLLWADVGNWRRVHIRVLYPPLTEINATWQRMDVPDTISRIMLMRPADGMQGTSVTTTKRPVELNIEVADVEEYFEQPKKQKIKPTTPLTDQWWGDRTFSILDPYGYQIWVYQNVAEPKLPQGAKVV